MSQDMTGVDMDLWKSNNNTVENIYPSISITWEIAAIFSQYHEQQT